MSKINELHIVTEKIKDRNNVSIELDKSSQMIDFEVNMLQNNPSLPFLELALLKLNDKSKILYDVGSKKSLSEFVNNAELGKTIIFDIIESIYKIINSCNEFMLDNNKILLDLNYMYIDVNSLLIYMIYLPIDLEKEYSIEDRFKSISKELVGKLKISKKELTPAEKKLISIINKKSYSIQSIGQIFTAYHNEKNTLYKEKEEKSEIEELKNEEIYEIKHDSQANELYKTTNDKSVIEEDFKKIDGADLSYLVDGENEDDEEEDEDLNFKEYNEIRKFETRTKNEKLNKILILQLVVVLLIGSLVLVFSVNDKQFFIMMLCIMVFVFMLLVILILVVLKNARK